MSRTWEAPGSLSRHGALGHVGPFVISDNHHYTWICKNIWTLYLRWDKDHFR